MSRTMTAQQRSSLIRLSGTLPVGSPERKTLLRFASAASNGKAPKGNLKEFLDEVGDQRVTNPVTKNKVKVRTLSTYPEESPAYKYFWDEYQRWLKEQEKKGAGKKEQDKKEQDKKEQSKDTGLPKPDKAKVVAGALGSALKRLGHYGVDDVQVKGSSVTGAYRADIPDIDRVGYYKYDLAVEQEIAACRRNLDDLLKSAKPYIKYIDVEVQDKGWVDIKIGLN